MRNNFDLQYRPRGYFWAEELSVQLSSDIKGAERKALYESLLAEGRAVMIYEDGNDREHARQEIPYTDFPLDSITFYACWDGENWVIMLPSEY